MATGATASRLFVYGTLLAPEVLEGLLRRVPSHKPAVLHGFSRWKVAEYPTIPAIVRSTGGTVEGHLLEGLDGRELRALDFYEDDGYERLLVEIECSSHKVEANAYVWPAEHTDQLTVGEGWSYEEFRDERMAEFVTDIVLPCRDAFEAEDAPGAQ